jgi:putative molybdopterin biosynthesis protein
MGGLLAIKKHETHFSGCHLLDPVTGIYNLSDIKKTIPEIPVTIMKWANRKQGLIVNNGNPKKILSLNDLHRLDVVFMNRQRGSGTRVLLDYQLGKLGLNTSKVKGYDLEEYTHLGVAVAVASGRADCGLGIASAAAAMGLDFIPLYDEEYQLIFPQNSIIDPLIQPIFEIINDTDFRKDILKLPGYDLVHMGECTYTNG